MNRYSDWVKAIYLYNYWWAKTYKKSFISESFNILDQGFCGENEAEEQGNMNGASEMCGASNSIDNNSQGLDSEDDFNSAIHGNPELLDMALRCDRAWIDGFRRGKYVVT